MVPEIRSYKGREDNMGFTIDKIDFIEILQNWGGNIVRIADTALLSGIGTEPSHLLEGFPRAVSIAVRLSDAVMDQIDHEPTPLYSSHYSRVNALLDDLAVRTTNVLQAAGAKAVPIPASLILDPEKWTSFISHKAVAIAAGIGWQGKSLLVVNPEFGPRIRLVTILTDADLEPDAPIKNRCGKCTQCRDHCPAGAILGVNTESHYDTRHQAVNLDRCVYHLQEVFGKLPHVNPLICGVCIRVCPWGVKTDKKKPGNSVG